MADNPEARLPRRVRQAQLSSEEPTSGWIAEPDGDTLTIQVEENTLIALLRSNCHRMAHRRRPGPTLDDLRTALQS